MSILRAVHLRPHRFSEIERQQMNDSQRSITQQFTPQQALGIRDSSSCGSDLQRRLN